MTTSDTSPGSVQTEKLTIFQERSNQSSKKAEKKYIKKYEWKYKDET